MLDRKEEHLDTGNRPSATAHIRAGVSADGMLTAFDAQSWGTGGAGAGSNFPLPYIYVFPNRRRTHKDVYINAGQQRAMRAPGHPQGCFLTEILMDELADRVQDGSGRVPHQERAAAGAERDVGVVSRDRRQGVRLGQAPRDGRRAGRADQDRHGLLGASVGRRRSRIPARTSTSCPTAAWS